MLYSGHWRYSINQLYFNKNEKKKVVAGKEKKKEKYQKPPAHKSGFAYCT